jgi:hypothetical protein
MWASQTWFSCFLSSSTFIKINKNILLIILIYKNVWYMKRLFLNH